jgi:hypothetical protein
MSIKKAHSGGRLGWVALASATVRATFLYGVEFSFCLCRAGTPM